MFGQDKSSLREAIFSPVLRLGEERGREVRECPRLPPMHGLLGREFLFYQMAPSILGNPLRSRASTMGMVMMAVMAERAGTHQE